MSDVVITVEGLGKRYSLGHQPGERYTALRDVLADKAKSLFRRNGSKPSKEDFWALKDVSFKVHPGEVLGIIGRNGAGKSTLLKVLSRITEPTEGRVKIKGRVASLLEVGTGFHPELTGRENIFLNGAILGMTKAEIKAKFDEIVAFAEVEKFLDTPVKRYSSGMYVRLAFAVAAHLEPEILVVDEVLAVGDAEFQKKCLGKMQQVAKGEGRTVLFVSHNMGAISQLCSRAILIRAGRVEKDGLTDAVISVYAAAVSRESTNEKLSPERFRGPLREIVQFYAIRVLDDKNTSIGVFSPHKPVHVQLLAECVEAVPAFRTTLAVFHNGVRLFSMHDVADAEPLKGGCEFSSTFELPADFLRPGDYQIAIGGHSAKTGEWLWGTDLAGFSILEEWSAAVRSYDTGVVTVPRLSRREWIT